MEWDGEKWVGSGGTSITQTGIRADGHYKAKLCIHPDVNGDAGQDTDGTYTLTFNATALAGGASLNIFLAPSGSGNLPDMELAEPIWDPLEIQGGVDVNISTQVVMSECQWIVLEVDDPTPETPVLEQHWGKIKTLYR